MLHQTQESYLLLPSEDLLQEVYVHAVDLRQVGFAVQREELIELLLTAELVLNLLNVDSSEGLVLLLHLYHVSVHEVFN